MDRITRLRRQALHALYETHNQAADLLDKLHEMEEAVDAEAARPRLGGMTYDVLMQGVLNAIPDMIMVKDTEGVYFGCNPAFTAFAGRPENEIVGRNQHDLFDKQQADILQAHDALVLLEDQPHRNEQPVRYPDGSTRILDMLKVPLHGEDGKPVGIVGVGRDITARKKTETELRESNARFRNLVANVPGVVFACLQHEDGTITFPFVSEGTEELLGLSTEAIADTPRQLLERIHEEDRVDIKDVLKRTRREGLAPVRWTGRVRLEDRTRWIQVSAQPELRKDGVVRWDGIVTNVTAEKTAEVRLWQAKEAAENAREEALDAQRAQAEFLGMAAHDLRNPLAGIDGLAATLLEEFQREANDAAGAEMELPQRIEMAELIRDSTQRLLKMVDDLVSSESKKSGRAILSRRSMDLCLVVEDALQRSSGRADRKEIDLHYDGTDTCTAHIDPSRMREALGALIGYSVRQAPIGGNVWLNLSSQQGQIVLTIRHDGPALSEDARQQLFREDPEEDAPNLRHAKHLIELHEGQLRVESTDDQNTQFRLEVPAAEAA